MPPHPVTRRVPGHGGVIIACAAGACYAAVVALFIARNGIGMEPDSIGYLSVARHLLSKGTFTLFDGRVFVDQPPLYPLLLAACSIVSAGDPVAASHWIAVAAAFVIMTFAVLIMFTAVRRPSMRIAGIVIIAGSWTLLRFSLMAMSDAVFLAFLLPSLHLLIRYAQTPRLRLLATAGVLAAAGAATRYVGSAAALSGIIALALVHRHDIRTFVSRALLFGGISLVPAGLWVLRNVMLTGAPFGRRGDSVRTVADGLRRIWSVLLEWFAPYRFREPDAMTIGIGVLAAVIVAYALTRRWCTLRKDLAVLPVFIIVHLLLLVWMSAVADFNAIGSRLMLPVFVPIVLTLLHLAERALDRAAGGGRAIVVRAVLIAYALVWVKSVGAGAAVTAARRFADGAEGFGNARFRNGALMRASLRQASERHVPLYSNASYAYYPQYNLVPGFLPDLWGEDSDRLRLYSALRGTFPPEGSALIAFFTPFDELPRLRRADLDLLVHIDSIRSFPEGELLFVTRAGTARQ